MSDLEKQVKRIQDKVQQLLKQQQLLSKENEELKNELIAFKKDAVAQKATIDELKQQASILKMNSVEMDDTDKKEFEKRLNHYIKEIDRCIAMLRPWLQTLGGDRRGAGGAGHRRQKHDRYEQFQSEEI